MKNLTDKTAFVTGAASGIGLGIASALAKAGAKVMLCDIEEPTLSEAMGRLKLANASVDGFKADVSLKSEITAAAEATVARYGKVHILVNNAGIGGGGPYGYWSDDEWNWTIGVNLMAVIWGTEIFGPLIEKHGEGGHIVSTASIAGLVSSGSGSYNVTKYGVVALSEGLRDELKPRGIGVSVLCPGFVRTNIADSWRHFPQRFDAGFLKPLAKLASSEIAQRIRARIAYGIDPLCVGELVREGIENDWFYIFTDAEFEPIIETRFAEIKKGFDRIRLRESVWAVMQESRKPNQTAMFRQ
jgi:NAD(P)-dependent dehydrogenase (short-subunit alcohol dehydrogenase family)